MYNFIGYFLTAYGIVFLALIIWFLQQIKIDKKIQISRKDYGSKE